MTKILFLQPIVSHYRKSIVEELYLKNNKIQFWGTKNYLGVEPICSNEFIKNNLETESFNIFKINFLYYKGLFNKIKKEKFDTIVISGINPKLINFNLICIYYKLFTNKKIYWWSQGKKFNQGFLGKTFRKYLYNLSDGVFLYSNEGKINFINEGIDKNKLFVINNCINNEDYGYLNYTNLNNSDFSLLYSGRLAKRKKLMFLLEALTIIKNEKNIDIKLNIIGDGEDKELLKKYCIQNNLKKVVFHGAKYGKEVHEIFLNASLMVMPGAVGLSIVHAFSFGIPLLTSKNDPAHSSELELLKEGKTGGFFKLDDSNDLANQILIWKNKMENDKVNYVKNCIEIIEQYEYTPQKVATKILNKL